MKNIKIILLTFTLALVAASFTDFIKAKFKCEKSHKLYDDLVERILEGETEAQEENNG